MAKKTAQTNIQSTKSIHRTITSFLENEYTEYTKYVLATRELPSVVDGFKTGARKGSDEKKYFYLEDYKKDETKLKGYKIIYNKGLGGLDNTLYKEMMQSPTFHYFSKDALADSMLRKWFAKGIADERKDMLRDAVEA